MTSTVSKALRDSIQYALDHRDEALAYAMQFARDVDSQLADKFVGMYVNERTLDYGPDGREAVRRLLDMGHKAGIIPREARVDFVGKKLLAVSLWLLALLLIARFKLAEILPHFFRERERGVNVNRNLRRCFQCYLQVVRNYVIFSEPVFRTYTVTSGFDIQKFLG